MEHEEIDEEFVAVDVEPILAADEGEPGAELEEESFDVGDQGPFEVAFGDRISEGEELQVVGVFDELLHELGVAGGESGGEVGRGGADTAVQLAHDLVDEHGPGPAVFDRRSGVPFPHLGVVGLVEQLHVMPPRQLGSNLLHN